jgi:hypothetical protein
MRIPALLFASMSWAAAQGTISPTNRYAYAANAGWIDFAPTVAASNVGVSDTYLSGYAYAANFGYISFGSGAPANGHTYGNASAVDYGVNISPSGQLTGYAYAPNAGWIQFEQALGSPRINLLNGQFVGYAYSANLGWISLDTPLSDLVTTTLNRTDSDGDGIPDAWEKLYFGNLTTANALTDFDGDGASDLAEYRAGTLPNDRTSVLRITASSFSSDFTAATLTFTIVPTRRYRIEYDTDLVPPWTDSALGTFTPSGVGTETRSITLPAAPRRFYRAVAVQPF